MGCHASGWALVPINPFSVEEACIPSDVICQRRRDPNAQIDSMPALSSRAMRRAMMISGAIGTLMSL
jgi:hypothetical protein